MLNGRPTKVTLHGPLGDMFGREHLLHIHSAGEAIRALCVLREGFRAELSRPGACYSVLAGADPLPIEGVNIGTGGRDIHIVPAVAGAKSDGATILIGAAIMVASYYTLGTASLIGLTGKAAAALGTAVTSIGLGMAIGGVVSMLSPTDRPGNEGEPNRPSRLFSGAVNTIAQNHPVQLCYGEAEIGSAVLSAMIDYGRRWDGGGGGNGPGGHGYGQGNDNRWLDKYYDPYDDGMRTD